MYSKSERLIYPVISIFLAVFVLCSVSKSRAQVSPSTDVVFADSFATNTLDQYDAQGGVTWNEAEQNLTLPGGSSLYSDTTFGNEVVLSGEVYIPASNQNQYGSVALALRDEDQTNLYWATLAYGSSLSQEDHMSIMLNDSWGELAPITLEHGSWYKVKLRTTYSEDGQYVQMKAWKDGNSEPSNWQVSRSLPLGFSAGGVGFRHYGNGTKADNLVVHSSRQVQLPWKDPLPKPIVADHPEWVDLYWEAWKIASGKVQQGTDANGFVDLYLDEGFNDHIFQWDTCFMMFFASYANGFVPSIVSLDNFYLSQHPDGAIDREILESDGSDFHDKSDPAYTNPPLFAWAEWDYYMTTGDSSRFDRVLPVLDDYYEWTRNNRRSDNGMYWYSNLGSGMDNAPRPENEIAGWIDYTSQQAMEAHYMVRMAEVIGRTELEDKYRQRYEHLKNLVNQYAWNAEDGYFWDVGDGNQQIKTKTAASFWPMIAGLTDSTQNAKLVAHLKDPDQFYRPHLFPTLSADHTVYAADGDYWRGGVWAPTNMMYIKGLQKTGYEAFATEAARNHLSMMTKVYNEVEPHSIWENYAPESADRGSPSRAGFVGWSGNGPITLLIENILGFRPNAPGDTLIWRPTLTGRHGIEDLSWGDHKTDITVQGRTTRQDTMVVSLSVKSAFTLSVKQNGNFRHYHLQSGEHQIKIPGQQATGLKQHPDRPTGFGLGANYPNPFNPTTTIPYKLEKAATVSLSIYDTGGRKITTLVHQKRQGPGKHRVTFRAENISSGVYYYRLSAGENSWQRSMLLVK